MLHSIALYKEIPNVVVTDLLLQLLLSATTAEVQQFIIDVAKVMLRCGDNETACIALNLLGD